MNQIQEKSHKRELEKIEKEQKVKERLEDVIGFWSTAAHAFSIFLTNGSQSLCTEFKAHRKSIARPRL